MMMMIMMIMMRPINNTNNNNIESQWNNTSQKESVCNAGLFLQQSYINLSALTFDPPV
jgi:hypothetical protein